MAVTEQIASVSSEGHLHEGVDGEAHDDSISVRARMAA
jgi:hypothetical protein